jgi:thiol-disulfide isomerase/thioredoxin
MVEMMQAETKSEKPNPGLVVFLIIPLLGILGALLMLANDLQSRRENGGLPRIDSPAELTNFVAPEFMLNDMNGMPISLSDYRGKILFLNFWQTTCPPCIEELPDYMAFIEDQPDDVTWLTVNVEEDPQTIREFFAAYDLFGIPVVLDPESLTRYAYGVFAFPVSFVIDEEGVVRYVKIGQMSYDEMTEIVEIVRKPSP